eukprot:TRINITY_DN8743_c0_g1_i3.p2 TRINITY_DN8743_c0_g1~~TRINITY_DN8743_c0_g1_i3.p2  ORF type:complete len:173 (+),score=41.43 TRINITY_DN8743_c0_g1_i3:177-695(+)
MCIRDRVSTQSTGTPEMEQHGVERLLAWAEEAGYVSPAEASRLRDAQRRVVAVASREVARAGFSFKFFSMAYQKRLGVVLLLLLISGYLNALSAASAGWRVPRVQFLDLQNQVLPTVTLPDLGHDLTGFLGDALLPREWMTEHGALGWEEGALEACWQCSTASGSRSCGGCS